MWSTITEEYELLSSLGSGGFGEVMKARHIKSNKTVAIKLMTCLFDHLYTSKKLVSEIQIMRKLSSMPNNDFTPKIYDVIAPNIVMDSKTKLPHLFIVMEFVDSDLQKLLKHTSQDGVGFDEDHVKFIIYNVLCSLNFLHSAKIMHRDIKPANILVNKSCFVKICDFGLSRTRTE